LIHTSTEFDKKLRKPKKTKNKKQFILDLPYSETSEFVSTNNEKNTVFLISNTIFQYSNSNTNKKPQELYIYIQTVRILYYTGGGGENY